MKKNPVQDKKGFSLTEIMIALVIIGILAAIAVPNFFSNRPRHRLKKAAIDLISTMQGTKLEAIKSNSSWALYFHNNAGATTDSYQVVDCGTAACPAYANPITPAMLAAGGGRIVQDIQLAGYGSQIQFADAPSCGNATADWNDGALDLRTSLTYTNRGLTTFGSVYLTNINNVYCYHITTTIAGGKRLRFYNGMTPFNKDNWSN